MSNGSVDQVERDHNKVINHFFHDFHGEIAIIEMCIGAVRDGTGGPVGREQRIWLERAIDNCEHMVRLIRNYRDRTQMEEGLWPRVPQRLDLSRLLAELRLALEPAARARAVRLELRGHELPTVSLRAQLLFRAMENLLLLVIDNTPTGGAVQLEASMADALLVLRLRYEGDELDPAVAATVFDPVRQAEVGLRLGRGYTLQFCKQALACMDGDIRLAPWSGHGNELIVSVPCDPADGGGESDAVR